MLAAVETEKTDARGANFDRLFPSKQELDARLASAMRTPKRDCLTKEQVLRRMASSAKWNIYYSVEDNTMKILDIIHQSQGSSF